MRLEPSIQTLVLSKETPLMAPEYTDLCPPRRPRFKNRSGTAGMNRPQDVPLALKIPQIKIWLSHIWHVKRTGIHRVLKIQTETRQPARSWGSMLEQHRCLCSTWKHGKRINLEDICAAPPFSLFLHYPGPFLVAPDCLIHRSSTLIMGVQFEDQIWGWLTVSLTSTMTLG